MSIIMLPFNDRDVVRWKMFYDLCLVIATFEDQDCFQVKNSCYCFRDPVFSAVSLVFF